MGDDAFDRLQSATDRVRTNLVDLEHDPHRVLLDAAPLAGQTAARWAEATRSLEEVWGWFVRLTDLLERADALGGAHRHLPAGRRAQIDQILTGASIELSRTEVPLAQRGLLGEQHTTRRCSPDELLAMMTDGFQRVSDTIAAVGAAWDTLVPRVRATRDRLTAVAATAAAVGGTDARDIGQLSARLDTVSDRLATDPLAVDERELDELDGDVSRVTNAVAAAKRLRDEFDQRLAAARMLLEQLRAATVAAAEAHRQLLMKVANPDVRPPPTLEATMTEELDRIGSLGRAQRWGDAALALAAWEDRVAELLRRAADSTVASRGPIGVRNELRALLDGYAAMAARTGRLEDATVSARYQRAHDVLYTAPTDLREAAELVRSYQELCAAEWEPGQGGRA